MTTSRYSLGTTIVRSPDLLKRPPRSTISRASVVGPENVEEVLRRAVTEGKVARLGGDREGRGAERCLYPIPRTPDRRRVNAARRRQDCTPARKEVAVKKFAALRREFSPRSMLFGAIFTIMLVVAIVVDLAALLQFSGLVSGLPHNILEIGGSLTALTILPLLVMGMSISVDLNHKK